MLHYCTSGPRNYHVRPVEIYNRYYWEFQIFVKGHSCADFHKSEKNCGSEGNFWIFSPDCPHGWKEKENKECSVAVFHFSEIPEMLSSQFYNRRVLSVTLPQQKLDIISHIAETHVPEVISPDVLSPLRHKLCLDQLSLIFLEELRKYEVINHLSKERIIADEAIAWFCSHMEEGPEIEDIAQKMGYNASHLRRIFHLITGEPPVREFTKQKMIRAAEMLKSRSETVIQISLACGYKSQSSFTRAFKNYYGISPEEFRRSNRQQ